MADRQMVDIASDTLAAAINPYGAELTHLRDAQGRELMTNADPAFWTGHAPILFPVIGLTNGGVIRVDGQDYPIGKHGFARHSLFDVVTAERDRAVFQLRDGDETRAAYPFAFLLQIGFTITGTSLSVEAIVRNTGDRAMPAQFGFHPALAWPLPFGEPRENHRITFAADEPEQLLQLNPDGLVADGRRPNPLDGRELLLRDALFTDDALIFDPVHSTSVRYGAAQGPVIEVAFADTPRLGVWTKTGGARFICIEPWHGLADPEGFTGELKDKPGTFLVEPGDEKRMEVRITLQP